MIPNLCLVCVLFSNLFYNVKCFFLIIEVKHLEKTEEYKEGENKITWSHYAERISINISVYMQKYF